MDFLRSYSFKIEPLISCSFLSSRFSCNQNIITLSECLSNVLITGESNFDEKNSKKCSTFLKKELLLKIHTLCRGLGSVRFWNFLIGGSKLDRFLAKS